MILLGIAVIEVRDFAVSALREEEGECEMAVVALKPEHPDRRHPPGVRRVVNLKRHPVCTSWFSGHGIKLHPFPGIVNPLPDRHPGEADLYANSEREFLVRRHRYRPLYGLPGSVSKRSEVELHGLVGGADTTTFRRTRGNLAERRQG